MMKVDGRCHCGRIQYTAEIDPERTAVCHCTDCQSLSGSAFRSVAFTLEDAFELVAGSPRIYIKIAESGRERAQAFCENCGSAIYATSVGDGPKVYGLRAGTLTQRGELKPTRQVWRRSAQPWTMDISALPATETQ